MMPQPPVISRSVFSLLFLGFAIVMGLFYFFFDPMTTPLMPKCLFHELTGFKCMGCGSQRMIHALLHGNIAEAFRVNALATLSLPFMAFLLVLEILRSRIPHLYARVFSVNMIRGCAIVLSLWMISRNIFDL